MSKAPIGQTSIYLDYAAASPVDPRVVETMRPYWHDRFGNPSSFHAAGQEARTALETARRAVAELIGAESPETIVFPSGATEANNLALIGYILRNVRLGRHLVLSPVEHMSVVNAAKYLEKQNFDVTVLSVDAEGLVAPEAVREALQDDTVLVSIQWANVEIGTVQPVAQIGAVCRERGVALHVDATAAAGKLFLDVDAAHVDLLTISSNDLYGPKGAGALYIRRGVRIQPMLLGGGQEGGLRSGSENVPALVGFGAACEIAQREWAEEGMRLRRLRDRLIQGVLEAIPDSHLTGHPTERLPHHASFRFDFVEGEAMTMSLAMEGVCAATGSARTSKTLEPSHVLLALGLGHEQAHGSLVFTLGRWSEQADVDKVLEVLPGILARLRSISPLYSHR